jgi:hypothetical protein
MAVAARFQSAIGFNQKSNALFSVAYLADLVVMLELNDEPNPRWPRWWFSLMAKEVASSQGLIF